MIPISIYLGQLTDWASAEIKHSGDTLDLPINVFGIDMFD